MLQIIIKNSAYTQEMSNSTMLTIVALFALFGIVILIIVFLLKQVKSAWVSNVLFYFRIIPTHWYFQFCVKSIGKSVHLVFFSCCCWPLAGKERSRRFAFMCVMSAGEKECLAGGKQIRKKEGKGREKKTEGKVTRDCLEKMLKITDGKN